MEICKNQTCNKKCLVPSNPKESSNIFCEGMTDREFVQSVIANILGEDWYVAAPVSQNQVNEYAFCEIMRKVKARKSLRAKLWQVALNLKLPSFLGIKQ